LFDLGEAQRIEAIEAKSRNNVLGSGTGVMLNDTVARSNCKNIGKANGSPPSTKGLMPETVNSVTGESNV